MKLLILILILLPAFSLSQKINTTENKNKSNIYNDAIKEYLINSNKTNNKIDTLFVEKTESFDDSILKKINGTIIKIMDGPAINSKLDLEKSFTLNRFFSLEFDKGFFSVSVIPFGATKDSTGLNLINGGGCKIFYTFDNASQQFHFRKISCSGI